MDENKRTTWEIIAYLHGILGIFTLYYQIILARQIPKENKEKFMFYVLLYIIACMLIAIFGLLASKL